MRHKEARCSKCKKLLGKYSIAQDLEIQCPRCKTLNTFNSSSKLNISLDPESHDILRAPAV